MPEIAADYRGAEHGRRRLHRRRRDGHRAPDAVQRGDRAGRRRAPRRAHPVRLDRPGARRGRHPGRPARLVDATTGCAGSSSTRRIQAFEPNDRSALPAVRGAAGLGVPALFHTGQTGIGAGLPGGRGIKLRYSDPMLLDDVAADFPGLTIIMAHPSVPWQDAAISVAHAQGQRLHRPVRLVAEVLPAAAGPGRQHAAEAQGDVRLGLPAAAPRPVDRATSRRWRSSDEVRPLIMKENAIRGPRAGRCVTPGSGSWPERRLRISPDRDAIWFEGTTTSHGGFAHRVRRTAAALAGPRRAAAGDRVAWTGGNHPSALETLYACGQLGAIWVPVNARLAAPEARVRARALRRVGRRPRPGPRRARRRPAGPAAGVRTWVAAETADGRRRRLAGLRAAAGRRRPRAPRRAGHARRPLPDHVHVRHHRAAQGRGR